TTWCAGYPNAVLRASPCLAGLHLRCSRGWRRTSSAGWFRSRAMRSMAPCISPGVPSWRGRVRAAALRTGANAEALRHNRDRVMRTEQISPRYVELDSWSAAEMIAAMYEGQLAAAAAVRGALGAIAAAVDDAVLALQRGGRIVYVGAGTSGR